MLAVRRFLAAEDLPQNPHRLVEALPALLEGDADGLVVAARRSPGRDRR